MPLVLIKEDGSGKVDANAFANAADGDAYHDGHLYASAWTGATTQNKEKALVMATRLIGSLLQFRGVKRRSIQALQWPRRGCPDPDTDNVVVGRREEWSMAAGMGRVGGAVFGIVAGKPSFLYCTSIGRKKTAEFGLANGDWRMGTMSRSRVCLSPFVSPHSSVKIPGRIIGGHFGAVAEGAGLCGCCAGDCGPACMEILRRFFFSASLPISAVFWFCFGQPFGDERAAEQNTAEIGRNAEGCGWLSLRPGPRR